MQPKKPPAGFADSRQGAFYCAGATRSGQRRTGRQGQQPKPERRGLPLPLLAQTARSSAEHGTARAQKERQLDKGTEPARAAESRTGREKQQRTYKNPRNNEKWAGSRHKAARRLVRSLLAGWRLSRLRSTPQGLGLDCRQIASNPRRSGRIPAPSRAQSAEGSCPGRGSDPSARRFDCRPPQRREERATDTGGSERRPLGARAPEARLGGGTPRGLRGGYASSANAEQRRSRAQRWRCWAEGAERPTAPICGGGARPNTYAATGAGCSRGKAAHSAPACGLGLAAAAGWPALRLAAGKRRRRADLSHRRRCAAAAAVGG